VAAEEVRAELERVAADMDAVATRNEERARKLLAEANALLDAGNELLKQAQALSGAAGHLRGEGVKAPAPATNGDGAHEEKRIERVGRKGRITLDAAAETAKRLGAFTRFTFADELGLSSVQVSLFLVELERVKLITHEGTAYRTT
jgi:hypothetical protein